MPMRPRTRDILERAIEEAIPGGYHHAHKHTENPSEDHIFSCIFDNIMLEIDQVFDLENPVDQDSIIEEIHQLKEQVEKLSKRLPAAPTKGSPYEPKRLPR